MQTEPIDEEAIATWISPGFIEITLFDVNPATNSLLPHSASYYINYEM